MERWVAEAMARRTRRLAQDFRRYPELQAMADKMDAYADQLLQQANR